MNAATTKPFLAVSLMPRTPWPPRPWRVEVLELGALAVAGVGDDEHGDVVAAGVEADDLVAGPQLHARARRRRPGPSDGRRPR